MQGLGTSTSKEHLHNPRFPFALWVCPVYVYDCGPMGSFPSIPLSCLNRAMLSSKSYLLIYLLFYFKMISVHSYIPSPGEVEVGRSEVQGHPVLHR